MKITHPTWIDPRVEIRDSLVHGHGAFALAPIEPGEVVTVWAHTILDDEDVADLPEGELHRRADGGYVWLPDSWTEFGGYDDAEEFLNHSCDPNVWMDDEVTLAARRPISPGEELTADYALWIVDPDYICPFECRCVSPSCRRSITGRDWKLPDLQQRYRGHWHPTIEARIAAIS